MSKAPSDADQPLSIPEMEKGDGPSGWKSQASLYDMTV
jgi:hypothetical protein